MISEVAGGHRTFAQQLEHAASSGVRKRFEDGVHVMLFS
jgi:hypothetical protein